jgi:hypothetical protein
MTTVLTVPKLGWHWSEGRDGHPVWKTRHLDGPGFNQVDVKVGTVVSLLDTVKIEPCRNGFHYCPDLLDSLRYGTGTFLSRVQGGGTMVQTGDKVAAQGREVIWWVDATDMIDLWAKDQVMGIDIPPSPARRTMIHAAYVAWAARCTWEDHPQATGHQWGLAFREILTLLSGDLLTCVSIMTRRTPQWRPDPPEAT